MMLTTAATTPVVPAPTGVDTASLRALVRGHPPDLDTDVDQLLVRSARGDEAAFARVYDATAARAFGLSLRVLRDRGQAEEVVQDSYLHVWLHAARYDPARGSAAAWILMVVHGRAVNRVRSSEARVRREATYERGATPRDLPGDDLTFEAVDASERAVRVRTALTALPRPQREAIELAYFGGRTHVEVADELAVPLGTVKARIRAGLGKLKDFLDDR